MFHHEEVSPFSFQFKRPPPKVPVKAICLATVLFVAGSALIVIGALLLSGHIESKVRIRITFTTLVDAGVLLKGVLFRGISNGMTFKIAECFTNGSYSR